MKNCYSYFQNKSCEYFPCHKTDSDCFNCLFCYCPLYFMENDCGGSYRLLADGTKDCSACLIPHLPEGYEYINSKLKIKKGESP